MKLTAKVKLLTNKEQHRALKETLEAANAACNWISKKAWAEKEFSCYGIHKLTYHEGRQRFNLPSQIMVRCIAKVSDSYKMDHETMRTFRPLNAIAYDDRILRWYVKEKNISITSIKGRLQLAFQVGDKQLALLENRQGESNLVLHEGVFYLAAACNVEVPTPSQVGDFLGVDFGIANVAADSDGKCYSGSALKSVRHRQRRLRTKLQKKGTTSANRRLKKLADKEHRFATHTNHVISKQIVATAKGTGRGISVEDLSGIRDRVKVRHEGRVVLHSWAFFQLKRFVLYKAAIAGVAVVQVDARNSSRECSRCGHTDKANRPSQSKFFCRSCGFTTHADLNAAVVIRGRGERNAPERGSWQ